MIVDKYGADALRMSLIVGIGPGNDANFDEQKVLAYKKFANKLWNVSRYVVSRMSNEQFEMSKQFDNELMRNLNVLVKEVTDDMDNYRFYLAAEKLYHFTWHEFADKYIEESKGKDDPETVYTLQIAHSTILKLLHPFMPFVTEEIWQLIGKNNLLMVEKWPSND